MKCPTYYITYKIWNPRSSLRFRLPFSNINLTSVWGCYNPFVWNKPVVSLVPWFLGFFWTTTAVALKSGVSYPFCSSNLRVSCWSRKKVSISGTKCDLKSPFCQLNENLFSYDNEMQANFIVRSHIFVYFNFYFAIIVVRHPVSRFSVKYLNYLTIDIQTKLMKLLARSTTKSTTPKPILTSKFDISFFWIIWK